MTDQNKTARAEALQEAAEWLIRLGDQDLQDADIDAWNAWMEASPLHAQAFEDVHLLWDAAGDVTAEQVLAARHAHRDVSGNTDGPVAGEVRQDAPVSSPGITEATFQPRSSTSPSSRARPRAKPRRWIAVAASVAVLAAVAGVLRYQTPSAPTEIHLSAEIGTPKKVELSDGSRVDLDAGSQVVVQFSSQRRQVELVHGQAYFSVAKDPGRPFEVRADGALAQALGTHFSVAKRSDSVRVVVTEGHVQVSDLRANTDGIANHVVQLIADQGATLMDGGPLDGPVQLDASSNLAWLQGRVVYRSETLGNVVADLNRYSKLPIVLDDKQLAQLRVTGRWSTTDVETWLESIAQALSLSIVRRPDEILLMPSDSSARWSRRQNAGAPSEAPARR
jgi:transmembrane sensor